MLSDNSFFLLTEWNAYYDPEADSIFIKSPVSADVRSHELGHHLTDPDPRVPDAVLDAALREWRGNLVSAVVQAKLLRKEPTDRVSAATAERLQELIANFERQQVLSIREEAELEKILQVVQQQQQ